MRAVLLTTLFGLLVAAISVLVVLNVAADQALQQQRPQQLTQLHWNYGGDDEAVNQPPLR